MTDFIEAGSSIPHLFLWLSFFAYCGALGVHLILLVRFKWHRWVNFLLFCVGTFIFLFCALVQLAIIYDLTIYPDLYLLAPIGLLTAPLFTLYPIHLLQVQQSHEDYTSVKEEISNSKKCREEVAILTRRVIDLETNLNVYMALSEAYKEKIINLQKQVADLNAR